MICENCDRKTPLLRDKMFAQLESLRIAPETFIHLDPRERLFVIKEAIGLSNPPVHKEIDVPNHPENLGVLIIKPEMMLAWNKVVSFLTDHIGVEVSRIQQFTYKPKEYWELQGKALLEYYSLFPHGALITLVAITAPSMMVLFKHRTLSEYQEILGPHNPPPADGECKKWEEDSQRFFTDFFIREDAEVSLRRSICLPEAERIGLLTMEGRTCPGICWDFTGSFRRRTCKENARTFNGIHSPRDQDEMNFNLYVLRRII